MSYDSSKDALLEFDCGTSLAEHEHYRRQLGGHHDDDTTLISSQQQEQQKGGKEETIESLRDLLASDVLTDEGRECSTFASPFEAPSTNTRRKPSMVQEKSRFLQVPLVYCDQTASNRPVKSIEQYMERVCLPLYGNTHTNTSITGCQRYDAPRGCISIWNLVPAPTTLLTFARSHYFLVLLVQHLSRKQGRL
jgi:hypothetical protein